MYDQSVRQFDTFSDDYHWLYSDRGLTGEPAIEDTQDILAAAGPHARLLDCSCGIGSFAIALAKRGFDVTGSDGSQGMVHQATLAARSAGVQIPLSCCAWQDLPSHFADPFDLVVCLGNSICHATDRREMLRSLEGMRGVLKTGGTLVLHSRNWEQLRNNRTRFTHYPWRERDGQRCLPLYVWTFPERFDDAHQVDVVLLFDSGGEASLRTYPIVYYPFRLDDLLDRLRAAGFSNIRHQFGAGNADYRVIAS